MTITTTTLILCVALFGIAVASGELEKKDNDHLFHAGLPAAHANFVHRPLSEAEMQSIVQSGAHPHGEATGINEFPIPIVPKDQLPPVAIPAIPIPYANNHMELIHPDAASVNGDGPILVVPPTVPVSIPIPYANNNPRELIHPDGGLPAAHTNFVHRPAVLVEQEHEASLLEKKTTTTNGVPPDHLVIPVIKRPPPVQPKPSGVDSISERMISRGTQERNSPPDFPYGPNPIPFPIGGISTLPHYHSFDAVNKEGNSPESPDHFMPPHDIDIGSMKNQLQGQGGEVPHMNGEVVPVDPRHISFSDIGERRAFLPPPFMIPPSPENAAAADAASFHHGIIGSSAAADNFNTFHMIPPEARSSMLHSLPHLEGADARRDNSMSMQLQPQPHGLASGFDARMTPNGIFNMGNLPVNRHDIPNPHRTVPNGLGMMPEGGAGSGGGPVPHFLPNQQMAGLLTREHTNNLRGQGAAGGILPPDRSLVEFGRGFVPHTTADRSQRAAIPLPPFLPLNSLNHFDGSTGPGFDNEAPPPGLPPRPLPPHSEERSGAGGPSLPPEHYQTTFGHGKSPEEIPYPMLPHNIPSNMNPQDMTPAFSTFLRGFLRGSMPDKVAVNPSTTTTEERHLSANPPPSVTSSAVKA